MAQVDANIQNKFNRPNMIYKVTKDYDLGGNTLTIPAGCTLDFQGGSFSNGTVSLSSNNKILRGKFNATSYEEVISINGASNVYLYDCLLINTTTTSDNTAIAIKTINSDLINLINCSIKGQVIFSNTEEVIHKGYKVENCSIEGDFTERTQNYNSQHDLIICVGVKDVVFSNNTIIAKNVNRVIKTSDLSTYFSKPNVSIYTCENIVFDNNQFKADSVNGKQFWDMFNGTMNSKFTNNTCDIKGHVIFIEDKTLKTFPGETTNVIENNQINIDWRLFYLTTDTKYNFIFRNNVVNISGVGLTIGRYDETGTLVQVSRDNIFSTQHINNFTFNGNMLNSVATLSDGSINYIPCYAMEYSSSVINYCNNTLINLKSILNVTVAVNVILNIEGIDFITAKSDVKNDALVYFTNSNINYCTISNISTPEVNNMVYMICSADKVNVISTLLLNGKLNTKRVWSAGGVFPEGNSITNLNSDYRIFFDPTASTAYYLPLASDETVSGVRPTLSINKYQTYTVFDKVQGGNIYWNGTNWTNEDGTLIEKSLTPNKSTDFSVANIIYNIVSDIDLETATISIPTGCTLSFNGGRLLNGTIVLNGTKVLPQACDITDYTSAITINGTYKEGQILYDKTLTPKKMKMWNGTAWVNLDGSTL